MKTLGQLRIGDTFYIINWNGGYISSIQQYKISVMNENKIGVIIKWVDEDGDIHGRAIGKEEFNYPKCHSAYCESISADKEYVKKLLKEYKKKYLKKYNKLLKSIE